jgi:hypothetical protein
MFERFAWPRNVANFGLHELGDSAYPSVEVRFALEQLGDFVFDFRVGKPPVSGKAVVPLAEGVPSVGVVL